MSRKKVNTGLIALALLFGFLSISSCSTKKNTGFRRAYHNLTCRYNVYWNGNNALREGDQMLSEVVKDNYNEILRVYNYGDKKQAQNLNPKMDRAIKKASIGIQKHSMYFGKEEKVKYVKYSYLMMGKAHFYKQDYISARRVFDYVAKEYEEDPMHAEAYLWLAKTYIETERFEKAEATLNLLYSISVKTNIPTDVRRDLPLVQADFYIAQHNYNDAYGFLERAIELGNKKEVITRTHFILGQINQFDGELDLATEYYQKVVKRNPDYIMAFEARMNMAQCYDEGTGDSKNINKVLHKMVKDFRNKEFLDQIYYALADISLKDGDIDQTLEYLKLSVSSSVQDNYQKSMSALLLADLYFQQAEYMPAEAYYDTAVTFLPEDYPDYDLIKRKAAILSDIVVHTQTIQLQDSLLHLAAMDTTSLLALIDVIIEEYQIEKEKRAEEEELALQSGTQIVDMGAGQSNRALGGKWYFYNTQAVGMGRSEFKQKWGNRKLEDNWRMSDKRFLLQGVEEDIADEDLQGNTDSTQTEVPITGPETREYYLAGIPKSEEELQASRDMVIDAYQKLGFLYLEELNDTTIALETYLEFQNEYPDNIYRVESWYALYKIYYEQGNEERANYYKGLIVGNYPDSDYAHVILDPDYYVKQSQQKGQSAKLYSRAYTAFNREQYFRVINYADKALEEYPDDTSLIPRFLYLRAISLGKVDVPDTLYASLEQLIETYPNSAVTPRAQAVLRMLQIEYGMGSPAVTVTDSTGVAKPSMFSYDPDAMHLVMLVVNSGEVEIDPLKVRISDFKKKYFRLIRLRIKSLVLDNMRSIITIGNFENQRVAHDFYYALKNDEYVTSGLGAHQFDIYTISLNNYPILYREKNVKEYDEFFKAYYPEDNN